MNPQPSPAINASPTKEFFINILIRDVKLSEAISELVDNAIDGAKRLRPDNNFTGLRIDVSYNENSFRISDNCGGISVEIAENYAFRFGRPTEMPDELKTKRPVGQFGVGMKRALFKLGNFFRIESIAPNSSFVVEVNVDNWKMEQHVPNEQNGDSSDNSIADVDKWHFDFTEYRPNEQHPAEECGTTINVTQLHEGVKQDFRLNNFQNRLIEAISAQQSDSLEKGLQIFINEIPLRSQREQFIESDQIKPIHIRRVFQFPAQAEEETLQEVVVDIYAGVTAKPDYANAGWWIYCNGRLILKADKSDTTGWGIEDELLLEANDAQAESPQEVEGGTVPRAHSQFSRFRGFVYFESDNADLLPWNTTKTGVNIEAPIYRNVRLDMIRALRQVINFLNLIKREADRGETRYADLLERSTEVIVSQNIPVAEKFVYPTPERLPAAPPKTAKIIYSKPYDEVERAKELLGVRANREVGELTFDYFMSLENSPDA